MRAERAMQAKLTDFPYQLALLHISGDSVGFMLPLRLL